MALLSLLGLNRYYHGVVVDYLHEASTRVLLRVYGRLFSSLRGILSCYDWLLIINFIFYLSSVFQVSLDPCLGQLYRLILFSVCQLDACHTIGEDFRVV